MEHPPTAISRHSQQSALEKQVPSARDPTPGPSRPAEAGSAWTNRQALL